MKLTYFLMAITIISIIIWIYAGLGVYHCHIANHHAPAMGELFSSGAGANSSSLNQISPAPTYTITAYCPNECCCGKWADGITASGKPAIGKIVAAPPSVPFGQVLVIPGYGKAVVEDRGGAIKGNKLDVLFPTHQEAKNWGVQELEVTFMEME